MNVKPVPRALYDRQRTLERLASFLGHRDASRVQKADAVRWKTEAQGRGLHASTIRNDISEMASVWRWGLKNAMFPENYVNPFEGIARPKPKTKKQPKPPFSPDEAATIIAAARKESGWLRWLPLVLCATGARLNEVCQSTKDDVQEVDGVWVLRLHDEGEGRTLKNADSRRSVPLHPALIREGFLDYVAALPRGSSLWPGLDAAGMFGQRATKAGKGLKRWLLRLGIKDPAISPAHSWRHTWIEAARRISMPTEVRSAITATAPEWTRAQHTGGVLGRL